MDQQAVQAQIKLLTSVTQFCSEKVLDQKHKNNSLTSYEQQAYRNCVLKFMEMPQIVSQAMQGMQ